MRQRDLIRELEGAVQLRDRFLTIAAHELRTPITSLRLYIEAARRTKDPALLAQKLEAISRQEHRLMPLVEALLDVSRLRMGRRPVRCENFDFRELIQELLARFEIDRERSGSAVTLVAPAPVVGSWDRVGIESIASNLLSNALKFGQGAPIEIQLLDKTASVQLRVEDHGVGIASDELPTFFSPFVRGSAEKNYGGFGVGLWIARSIAELHGGTLDATSERGRGSVFVLSLPKRGDCDLLAGGRRSNERFS